MVNDLIQQEILLMINTDFATKNFSEKSAGDKTKPTQNEHLKDACWNGILKDMLPELFLYDDDQPKLYLWQLRDANYFFVLEMSEYPLEISESASLDPYRFLKMQQLN